MQLKALSKLITTSALILTMAGCQTTNNSAQQASNFAYKQGDVVQALVNIHVDTKGNRIDSLNYQLPLIVPVCSKFTIDAVNRTAVKLTANNTQYKYILNRHTRSAGQLLADNFKLFFGKKCDSKKIDKLSKLDRKGIKQGTVLIGMSKKGVIFSMGRPPIHANPTLDSNTWTYWRNRWAKRSIEFSVQGKVVKIR